MNNEVRIFKNTSELTYDKIGVLLESLNIPVTASTLKNKARSGDTVFLSDDDLRTLLVNINDSSHANFDIVKRLQNTHKFCIKALTILADNSDVDPLQIDLDYELGEGESDTNVLESTLQKSDEQPVTSIGNETEIEDGFNTTLDDSDEDFDEDFDDEDEDFDEDFDEEDDFDEDFDDGSDEPTMTEEAETFDDDEFDEGIEPEDDNVGLDGDLDEEFEEEDDEFDALINSGETNIDDDDIDNDDDDIDFDELFGEGSNDDGSLDEMPEIKGALATADDFESMADDDEDWGSDNFEF